MQRTPPPQPAPSAVLAQIPGARVWLLLTLVLAILFVALLVWLGWFRVPPTVERLIPAVPSAESVDQASKLRAEIADMETKLAQERAQSLTCPPGQKLGLGATPLAPQLPSATGLAKPVSNTELTNRLEAATALVLTESSSATGFFVASDLLVTNRHAVEQAKNGDVAIVSRSLGTIRQGYVLRASAPGPTGAADFALIKLREGAGSGVLLVTSQAPKLLPVVAAGYPGLTLMNDPGFKRLIRGDASAAPDLNLTQGVVQSLQTSPSGIPVILHTASILQGNSGGPLVDSCGRAIGINTFIAVDSEQSGRISYAQAISALVVFLGQSGVKLPVDDGVCSAG